MLNTKSLISNNKGVALYLAIVIMALLLAIALGINTILLAQFRMVGEIGDSVIAFFAADTGIERALYEKKGFSGQLDNGARYDVIFIQTGHTNGAFNGGLCNADNFCIKSIGTFKKTKRAIEISI